MTSPSPATQATVAAPQALTNLPNVIDPLDNEPVKRRVRRVSDLTGAHQTLWWADLESSMQRTTCQQMRDGVPPYSQWRERTLGLAGRANINWGMGDQIATEAELPYIALLDGIDNFCTMPTNFGPEGARVEWERIMSEEVSRMLRSWRRFNNQWRQNVLIFVDEGLSFAFFDDDYDWRWTIKGQQHIKYNRLTIADVEEIDTFTAQIEMLPHKLFEHLSNEDVAKEQGWNRMAVWEAIKTASQKYLQPQDFQEWEKQFKNNDFLYGVTNITVTTIHGWFRELDGTVSHYIACDGGGEFMYKKEGKYRNVSSMLIPYYYGIGANGDFQGIRGILQKIFSSVSGMNKVFCRMLDMAIHGSTPFIKTTEEDTITELPLQAMGQYGVLKPGADFVEVKVPPFEQTLIPVLNELKTLMRARSSGYSVGSTSLVDKTERTKYEQQMRYEQEGAQSTSGMSGFKEGWTLHLREVIRRIIRKGYAANEPGGQEVVAFRARCMERGVPEEAIYQVDVDRLEVNLGIGKGSAVERRVSIDTLMQNFFMYDPEGQNILLNMKTAAYAGTRIANLLAPLKAGLRPPQDAENAQLENAAIVGGQQMQVFPNQNHAVHLEFHIPKLSELANAVQTGQMMLAQGIPIMLMLFKHSEEHLQSVNQQDPQYGQFKAEMEQAWEVISNGSKKLDRLQSEGMDENGQPINGQPTQGGEGEAGPGFAVQAGQLGQKLADDAKLGVERAKAYAIYSKNAREDALAAAKIHTMGR